MRRAHIGSVIVGTCLCAAACGENGIGLEDRTVASIEFQPASPTVLVGGYVHLVAIARNAGGDRIDVPELTWTLDNASVARISSELESSALVAGLALGNATITVTSGTKSASAAIRVGTVGPYASIAAAWDKTCAVATDGVAWCWGKSGLGNGTDLSASVPTMVAGTVRFTMVARGHSESSGCGLSADGAAYCWGWNQYGELGIGTRSDPAVCRADPSRCTTPLAVEGGRRYRDIALFGGGACAVGQDNAAYCWGLNHEGQLGIGSPTGPELCTVQPGNPGTPCSRVPVRVSGNVAFSAIAAGSHHVCALATDGAAYCWGSNEGGKLGDGSLMDRHAPTRVAGGLTFRALAAGYGHTCGLTTDGAAYCWGRNPNGILGVGGTAAPPSGPPSCPNEHCLVPHPVVGGFTWKSISAGLVHTCAVRADDTAYCWGQGLSGSLGTGRGIEQLATQPEPVAGGLSFASVTTGITHTCGITVGGVAYCWGNNAYGQGGNGSTGTATDLPTRVAGQP